MQKFKRVRPYKVHRNVRVCGRDSHATCCIAGPLIGEDHPFLMLVAGCTPVCSDEVYLLDVDNGIWNKVGQCISILWCIQ